MAEEAALEKELLGGAAPGAGPGESPDQLQLLESLLPKGTEKKVGTAVIDIIIIIAIVIIGFIAAILLAISAGAITKITSKWRDDKDLKRAHTLMSWATALLFIGGFLLIGFYALFFIMLAVAYNYIFALTELFVAVLFFVAAILAFTAVGDIKKSPEFSDTNKEAKRAVDFGLAAGIMALISAVGISIWLVYSFIQFEKAGGVKGDIEFKLQVAEKAAELAG